VRPRLKTLRFSFTPRCALKNGLFVGQAPPDTPPPPRYYKNTVFPVTERITNCSYRTWLRLYNDRCVEINE